MEKKLLQWVSQGGKLTNTLSPVGVRPQTKALPRNLWQHYT